MPECRECEASFLVVNAGIKDLRNHRACFHLRHIEVDATDKEQARLKTDHPAKSGLPYAITSDSKVQRGNTNGQSYVYPEMWRTGGKKNAQNAPHSLSELVLQSIEYTHRALIINFGPLLLMIQWLTHTSGHVFTLSEWKESFGLVDKKLRKNKVGMALVFAEFVVVFLSHDLVFQPTWVESRNMLPPSPADFYSKDWVFSRCSGALDVYASDVFLGIGVYTVIEVFFLAGLSPLLTEAELFDNPSRTVRMGCGYLEFQHRSREGLPSLVFPAMTSGFLAPTKVQRLGYMKWLHVYAKDFASLPVRMAALVDDYANQVERLDALGEPWSRYETTSLYDVFEPTLVSTALSLPHNMGHLAFGAELWVELGGVLSDGRDPLTAYFKGQGLLDAPTFLRPSHYSPLFLPLSDMRSKSLPRRDVFTYRNDKQLWSITKFPENSQGRRSFVDSATPREIVGDERKRMLFKHIVENTKGVAIGPLEYSGNGRVVSVGRKKIATPCLGSTTIPEHHALRDLKSRHLPTGPGVRRELTASGQKEYDKQAAQVVAAFARKRARDENDPPPAEAGPSKPKKKRLSADQRLTGMAHA
ncbi:hypothetical protein B0H15DRAFT_958636 [Mycena belliarum]|uniref:Uncharacterized protein n=1 Tax=Mycena belliarum TaxID=1033014 RepID=A0AAD6TM58_9AGAR|nr:hypothetical protein B0H15DRAFT_958636 [Mycena belliae]